MTTVGAMFATPQDNLTTWKLGLRGSRLCQGYGDMVPTTPLGWCCLTNGETAGIWRGSFSRHGIGVHVDKIYSKHFKTVCWRNKTERNAK